MKATDEGFVPSYDGTGIYYRAEGEGFPLVTCNGALCSVGYWVYFKRFFRNRCKVVVWDYRGHGRSELHRNLSRVSIGSYCSDLKSILDRLKIPRTVLIGHSMGVQVILEFYRRHPERVASLILVCGSYGRPLRTFYGMQWMESVLPPILRAGERHAETVARVLKPLLRTWLPVPVARLTGAIHWYLCPTEIMKDYFHHMASLDFRMAVRTLQAIEEHSAEDVLGTIDVPTLVIGGEKDLYTPLWVVEKTWQSIPGAEFLVVPKGTHTALVENPLLVNMRIELFLRDHFLSQGYPVLKALGSSVRALPKSRAKGRVVSRGRTIAKKAPAL